MPKHMLHGKEARAAVLRGVNVLADVVAATLGPRGRHVMIDEHPAYPPLMTKDGVTAARSLVQLADNFENMGCKLVKAVASQTAETAGDGTTTSVVLARNIFANGIKLLDEGANPVALKRGIDRAVEVVVAKLNAIAQPVGDGMLARVGTISANGDANIGNLIAEAMAKVGRDGVITMAESSEKETTLSVIEGMQLDRGYAEQFFITDVNKLTSEHDFPYIILTERRFSAISETGGLAKVFNEVAKEGRSVLIIAEDFEAGGLIFLAKNKQTGALNSVGVKAPGFGTDRKAIMEDVAAMTGAYAFTTDCGRKLETITMKDLGRAQSVIVGRHTTTIVGGGGSPEKIQSRTALLRSLIENTDTDFEREKLRQRLARMSSGIAVIKVGGASETEMRERKARVEDAIHATKAAAEEGIVPGGGLALLSCIVDVDTLLPTRGKDHDSHEQMGVRLIRTALCEPLLTICANAGVDGVKISYEVFAHEQGYGYNAETCQYEDLIASGVLDPVKVTRLALQNAASVASMLLTTESCVAESQPKQV